MDLISKITLAFQHGGFWMYPILITQLVTFAIMAERINALYIRRKTNQAKNAAHALEDNIRRGEISEAIKKANSQFSGLAISQVAIAGAEAAMNLGGKDEIQGKMDEVLLHENSQLDRGIGFLATLGNVATLTGLLGTITGMIKSFAPVAYANPAEKAALLAAGISEAMNATAYGLIVAIPALVAYAALQYRANQISEDLNQSALKIFNWLSYTFDPVSLRNQAKTQSSKSSNNNEINA